MAVRMPFGVSYGVVRLDLTVSIVLTGVVGSNESGVIGAVGEGCQSC